MLGLKHIGQSESPGTLGNFNGLMPYQALSQSNSAFHFQKCSVGGGSLIIIRGEPLSTEWIRLQDLPRFRRSCKERSPSAVAIRIHNSGGSVVQSTDGLLDEQVALDLFEAHWAAVVLFLLRWVRCILAGVRNEQNGKEAWVYMVFQYTKLPQDPDQESVCLLFMKVHNQASTGTRPADAMYLAV